MFSAPIWEASKDFIRGILLAIDIKQKQTNKKTEQTMITAEKMYARNKKYFNVHHYYNFQSLSINIVFPCIYYLKIAKVNCGGRYRLGYEKCIQISRFVEIIRIYILVNFLL